jgi:polyhydroxybutyrate depolymerase
MYVVGIAGADVGLYTIAGKGHSWPGSAMPARITTREIDATAAIWKFFAAHPKP